MIEDVLTVYKTLYYYQKRIFWFFSHIEAIMKIRKIVLNILEKQNIKIDLTPYRISNTTFLDISTLQSTFMFKWYSKVNKAMLDVLQPAAFMMEVGKIIIAHELIEQQKNEAFQTALALIKAPHELSALEKEYVGFSNEEITTKIFEQWNLESELVESIKFSNDPFKAAEHIKAFSAALNVVKNSINIFGQLDDASIARSLKLLDEYGLNHEPFLQTIEQFRQ
jgi:HD-like signal output (HDOD) protein